MEQTDSPSNTDTGVLNLTCHLVGEMDLNLEITSKLQKQEKYQKFLEWATAHGLILKDVRFHFIRALSHKMNAFRFNFQQHLDLMVLLA